MSTDAGRPFRRSLVGMTPWLRPGLALLGPVFPLPLDRPFTLRQAEASGVSRHHVRVMAAAGLLRRMVKGVYVAAQVPDSIVLRGQALSLVVPSYSVVTDWTTCWFHTGYDRPGSHLVEPELSIVLFRRTGWDAATYQAWSDDQLAREQSFVTPTAWQGETVLRWCIVNPLTTLDDLGAIVASLQDFPRG